MTNLEIAASSDRHAGPSTHAPVELVLRQTAVAFVIAGLGIAAYTAFTHAPAGRQNHEREHMIEDWHGNSASIRPAG